MVACDFQGIGPFFPLSCPIYECEVCGTSYYPFNGYRIIAISPISFLILIIFIFSLFKNLDQSWQRLINFTNFGGKQILLHWFFSSIIIWNVIDFWFYLYYFLPSCFGCDFIGILSKFEGQYIGGHQVGKILNFIYC